MENFSGEAALRTNDLQCNRKSCREVESARNKLKKTAYDFSFFQGLPRTKMSDVSRSMMFRSLLQLHVSHSLENCISETREIRYGQDERRQEWRP